MNTIPRQLPTVLWQVIHTLTIPAFFLSFVMLYRPAKVELFLSQQISDERLAFNTLMMMCIMLVVTASSRGVMWLWKNYKQISWPQYIIWCVLELIVSGMFCSLYMTLMYMGAYPYFSVVGKVLGMLLAVLVYPYVILAMLSIVMTPSTIAGEEDSLVRFRDNTQKLKFIIACRALLYIEADENYIKIVYTEGDEVRTYSLRTSMKSIEGLMTKHGLLRCQRSYYINPTRIKALRRDKDGTLYADLNVANTKAIPVSAMYQKELSERL